MFDLIEEKSSLQPTQYVICSPNKFIRDRSTDLLPTWSQSVESVVLVLQKCPCSLLSHTVDTERVKGILRQCFLKFGVDIVQAMAELNCLAEVFDPSTGAPTQAKFGRTKLDDVALVHSLLSYPVLNWGGCLVLLHPIWKDAVYPSTILTSAFPEVVAHVIRHKVEVVKQQTESWVAPENN